MREKNDSVKKKLAKIEAEFDIKESGFSVA